MTPERTRAVIVCGVAAAWALVVCAHTYTRAASWHAPMVDHAIGPLEFWREAVLRSARAIAAALIVGTAAWQLGRTLLAAADDLESTALERGQFSLAVGVVALSSLLTALAVAGWYRPPVVAVVVVGLAVSRPRAALREAATAWRLLDTRVRSTRRLTADGLFALCGAAALACAVPAALAPESEYDALWYHLWLPARWLASGRLVDIVSEYVSLYPGGWEVLNGAALTLGGPVAAKLLHFSCLPLTAAAAWALTRRARVHASPMLVAALVVTAPTVLWESSTAYVDLALAWLVTLTVVTLFRFHGTGDRRWLVIGAITMGGALGVKHLALVVLGVATCAIAGLSYRRAGARALVDAALFASIALALASPWYLRDLAASGNPLFPEAYKVFGARPPARWSDGAEAALDGFKNHFGMGRRPAALLALPWNVTTHAARFGGTFGPAFLVLIPMVLMDWSGLKARPYVLMGFALGCAVYVAVWASPLGSFQLRFLLPIVPVMAIVAAAGAASLFARAAMVHRLLARAAFVSVAALLLLNLPPFIDWHQKERRGRDGWLTQVLLAAPLAVVVGAESEREYLSRTVLTYRAWQAIDAGTSPDSLVLTFAGGDHLYSGRARLWSDAWMAYPLTWGASIGEEAAARRAAADVGVTHVLFDKRQFEDDPGFRRLAFAGEAMRACCLRPFYEDERIVVYRFDPDGAESPSAVSRR